MVLTRSQNTLTAQLDGELDHHRAGLARDQIDLALDGGDIRLLRLDFSRVTFMDSSGIGLILGRYRRMETMGGRLELLRIPEPVEKMIRLAGISRLNIPCIPEEKEADGHETTL